MDVRCAVDEDARPTLKNLRHARQSMDAEYLFAREGGDAVGCGMSAVFPGMGDEPILWSDASVLPDRRSNGSASSSCAGSPSADASSASRSCCSR
jgi:hypothetical protein